jgi:hypothetical protein
VLLTLILDNPEAADTEQTDLVTKTDYPMKRSVPVFVTRFASFSPVWRTILSCLIFGHMNERLAKAPFVFVYAH